MGCRVDALGTVDEQPHPIAQQGVVSLGGVVVAGCQLVQANPFDEPRTRVDQRHGDAGGSLQPVGSQHPGVAAADHCDADVLDGHGVSSQGACALKTPRATGL